MGLSFVHNQYFIVIDYFMRTGKILLLLLMVISSAAMSAQTQRRSRSVNITGTVVEEGTTTPVEQATVRLLSVRDSSFIGGVASGSDGKFTLKSIQPGNYLLHISFIGFDPLYQPLQITGNTNPVDLGKMGLSDGAVLLGEAVVMGKAPEVIVRNDTIEYNADSFKVSEGSMLEDLLKKMPGVEVAEDGKITVNGKEIKKVLVDGKEFFSDDPKVASKNLPSNMVDKVQVLDRLSEMAQMTGFNDGDEEAVINLTVKPGMKEGWFGNAFAGYGNKDRYEGNAMVNRFKNNDQFVLMGGLNNTNNMGFSDMAGNMFQGMGGGGRGGFGGGAGNGITKSGNIGLNFNKEFNPKLTFNGNVRYSHSDNEAENKYDSESVKSETRFENGRSYRNNVSDNVGANFRLEWKPDDKTRLLFRPNFSYSKTHRAENENSTGLDGERDTINISNIDNYTDADGYNVNAQLEFSRKLNDEGRTISASLSGGYNETDGTGMVLNDIFYVKKDSSEYLDQRVKNDNTGYNYRAFVSWVEPIGNNNFIQLTYSVNQRKQEALKNAYNLDEDGFYTIIDTTQSQNYRNNYINQRAGVSFKSVREKFNYTVGINIDPSYTSSENFIGDTILSKMSRNVVNFSPSVQFRYNFNRQTNLRIDYNGRTSQPSMTQLQPVPDYTNLKNVKIGNPDLKPYYTNNLYIQFQSFNQESQLAMILRANGSYTVNGIVNYVINENDGSGNRTTTYRNVNGNYNGNLRFIINSPLKNRKFSVNSMTMTSFNNSKSLMGDRDKNNPDVIVDSENTNRNLALMERAGIDFRSSYLDLGVSGNIRYTKSTNTLNPEKNENIYNYGVEGRTSIYLPFNFKIESDISWSKNSGYTSGFEQNTILWNAAASKSFLKGNQATLRIKMYDILKQRSNISFSSSGDGHTYNEYNTLSSYFMVHFIYRFSIFKGGASANDVRGPGGRNPGGRGPGGPGGPPRHF